MANKNEIKKEEEIKEVKEAKEKVSPKNVIIIIAIIVALLFVGFYIYRWNQVKTEEKYNTSYLIDNKTLNLEIKNIEEVKQILTESPTEYFVLITYTKNEDTYNLETGLKKIIDEYKLSDSFYYFNIGDKYNDQDYLDKLNKAFNTDKIKKVPIILYYKDGKIVDTVTRKDNNIINAGDFQKLLDIYEYNGQ